MNAKININNGLYNLLQKNKIEWWENLKLDKDLYIDVRKENYLNIYCNGGSIMKLKGTKKLTATINYKYVPLSTDKIYVDYIITDNKIEFSDIKLLNVNNFENKSLELMKKNIKKFYPDESEKGIQGKFVTYNNGLKDSDGFFIDTEFQYENKRIDMVWVDLKKRKIFFVELKTIGDLRLYIDIKDVEKSFFQDEVDEYNVESKNEMIDDQLKKYFNFSKKYSVDLIEYYSNIFKIKNKLGILPGFVKEKSIDDFEIERKPILLVGDCTQLWIDNNAAKLNSQLKEFTYGCFYHGINTNKFRVPEKTNGNKFIFSS